MPEEMSNFPIPASLQDLEREPYNLLPYPNDFDDADEAARADSFVLLVTRLERGNQMLLSGGSCLFKQEEGYEPWMDSDRVQALYTLVRKSTSLAPSTRWSLIQALAQAVKILASILADDEASVEKSISALQENQEVQTTSRQNVVSQEFRDGFACHLYMLFSVMFILESEAKISNGMKKKSSCVGSKGKKGGDVGSDAEGDDTVQMRKVCAEAMLTAAQSMSQHRFKLWKRGVADECVVILPCRIACQMLESATGVVARKMACADSALAMIAATVNSSECLMSTVLAAIMDMMHSFEHMASLCAELCTLVSTNRLGMELIREVGRLDTCGSGDAGKASGIKFVAPFVWELAICRPQLVLANITHLLPHLETEPYFLRSAILTAFGYIVEFIGETLNPNAGENRDKTMLGLGETSSANLEKSRAALLDILLDRAHDVSSYTRSAVLKAWIRLAQSGSIPVVRILRVTAMAIDRLQDKTVIVRKQSLQLLTTLLENNPFMGDLDPVPYQNKMSEMYDFVRDNLPSTVEEALETLVTNAKERGESKEAIIELERASLAAIITEEVATDSVDQLDANESEFRSKVQALKFAQSALDFIDQYENASVNLHGMLLSANCSDVAEALRFFVKARHFKLPCAVTGMKQALSLMWSTEQSIKDEVLKAFVDVFIASPGSDGEESLSGSLVASNLLSLTNEATVSELASIEEAIRLLVKDGRVPAEVFSCLWSYISHGPTDCRADALRILAMAANADKCVVDSKSRLKTILVSGLGDHVEENRDWNLAYSAALALQRVKHAEADPSCAKHIVIEQIIEKLCAVARGDWCVDISASDTLKWFAAAEQAIGAIFVLSLEPEKSCADIIRGMHNQTMFGIGDEMDKCHPFRLSRFFHVLGHIALKLLVYTEALSGSVRRATAKKTLKMQEEADTAKRSKSKSTQNDMEDIDDELGMAAELEAENERNVAEIAEKEIVGRGLLSIFGHILVRVVANDGGKFDVEILRQTSTLALCKFMCVSSQFCEQHLPVVFAALANAPANDVTLRANTVIALGDLAFRFPNEVEPYTPRMYACLRDSSTKVRRHTLMVLTHLILNDMVKVKGQVCEIALCLRDTDQRIRDTSRLLFHELSKRSNNPVYNLLPDIVSQLSQVHISKEDFRSILSFLLGYVKKDKQNETLMEKLCQRFPKCQTISQKADIAYCMAHLKVNERSIKYLVDNFKLYKDVLFEEDVKKHFFSIISKAKKFAKPELKQALEEFESKLQEESEVGKENQLAGVKASKAKKTAMKKRRKNVVENVHDESDEESTSLDEEHINKNGFDKRIPVLADIHQNAAKQSRTTTLQTKGRKGRS